MIIEICPRCGHELYNVESFQDPLSKEKYCMNCKYYTKEARMQKLKELEKNRHDY